MNSTPEISVIMPVYNSEIFVFNAIQSILIQTFSNFEFIIINDMSNDKSLSIIKSFDDNRIKLINNTTHIGKFQSYNLGLNKSIGKYICMMDVECISYNNRLEQQFIYMNSNQWVGITGSGYKLADTDSRIYMELDYNLIKVMLLKGNCFILSTLFLDKKKIESCRLRFNESITYSVDYDFMVRAAECFIIRNMPNVFVQYQVNQEQILLENSTNQVLNENSIISINQLKYLKIIPSIEEQEIHYKLINNIKLEYSKKKNALRWIEKLVSANKKVKYYNQEEFKDFLISLWNKQYFFIKESFGFNYTINNNKTGNRIDLVDFTFVIPLRVESDYRKANLDTLLFVLNRDFNTKIIVLEADKKKFFYSTHEIENLEYHFVFDEDPIFHRTKYINKLLKMTKTNYVAVWDTDAIVLPEQIEEAANTLRRHQAILSFPYDGRFYLTDRSLSNLFKKTTIFRVLTNQENELRLMNGYHSVGGAFMVNKQQYLDAGGENENIYGWGPEDTERVKRMEVLGLPIYHSEGSMFHLWHPIGQNSLYANRNIEIINRRELLKTCQRKN